MELFSDPQKIPGSLETTIVNMLSSLTRNVSDVNNSFTIKEEQPFSPSRQGITYLKLFRRQTVNVLLCIIMFLYGRIPNIQKIFPH